MRNFGRVIELDVFFVYLYVVAIVVRTCFVYLDSFALDFVSR